jgi:competence protein ComGC
MFKRQKPAGGIKKFIFVIAILIALLLPALSRAKASAQRTSCRGSRPASAVV